MDLSSCDGMGDSRTTSKFAMVREGVPRKGNDCEWLVSQIELLQMIMANPIPHIKSLVLYQVPSEFFFPLS